MADVPPMTGPLVLPEDIEIVPLADFPAGLRAKVGGDHHDYAVTRPRSRAPSKVVDAQAAELLREFQKPTTLVEAMLRFSKAVRREPAEVIEDVYPFLESCLVAKLLVEPGTASQTIRASFEKGAVVVNSVANCEVLDCIQVLEDTEIYRVRAGEVEAVLKIARPRSGPEVKRSIGREAEILRRLNGQVAPAILSAGEVEDRRSYLLMEWCPGERCGEAAAAIRAGAHDPVPAALVRLCGELLDTYAKLHGLGVIHSDVHSNNVLVMENGEVRIIDHGLSRIDVEKDTAGDDLERAIHPRGGVGFFFEPEYAKAALSNSMLPISSRAGEQYSVAALVYFLLSGQYYLDFSYAKAEILRQIVEQPPIPLLARGMPGAGALEDVLFRALSKDPSARFPDLGAMASAFRSAAGHLPVRTSRAVRSAFTAVPIPSAEERQLADEGQRKDWFESTLDSLSEPAIALADSGPKFPTTSLMLGATGIAYGLFRIACIREDARLFALAERWLDRAEREIAHDTAFDQPQVRIPPKTAGRISLYHSASGAACVQALLAHSSGDLRARSTATKRFLKFSSHACQNPDLTLGKSGILLGLSLLLDAFRWDRGADHRHLIEAGNNLLTDLWKQFDAMAPIGDPKGSTHLGMAQGWAGYLYATLRWMRSARAPAPSNVQARLQQLANQARWRGSRAFWPSGTRSTGPGLGGWCKGSAGFVFLWTLAHSLLRDTQWLCLAEGAGKDVCHAREEGSSLCCGLSGKAYSQLCLYKHTGNRTWLDNASAMARLAIRKTEILKQTAGSPPLPLSLYKGDVGLAVLLADLEHPESSAMPFFESEAWPASDPHR